MKTFTAGFILLILFLLTPPTAAQVRTDFDRSMNRPVTPFRIIGNIYYVGASDVASYLITTPRGHILIDGGFAETVPQIEKNVRELGFKLADVRILLNNHAHSDHAGGLQLLREKTGARLFSVREQALALARGGKEDFAFGDALSFAPVRADRIIRDGEKIRLGKTKLKTYLTPGHTKGCTTWTTNVKENGRKYKVIFLCSTTALNYDLVNNRNYPAIARDFAATFARLKRLRPDVFLASHASFFKMEQKLRAGKNQNPFIDPAGYRDFIARTERAFWEKLAKQKAVDGQTQ